MICQCAFSLAKYCVLISKFSLLFPPYIHEVYEVSTHIIVKNTYEHINVIYTILLEYKTVELGTE